MSALTTGCLFLACLTAIPAAAQTSENSPAQASRIACTVVPSQIEFPAAGLSDSLFNVVGRFDSGPALDVETLGDVVFFSSGPFLVAVDVSGEPVEILRRRFSAPPVIVIQDSLAYIGARDTLRILDVRNPSSPVEQGSTSIQRNIDYIHISGGRAFIASGWDGMTIVDVSDPSDPREMGHLPAWQLSTKELVSCPNAVISVAGRDSVAFVGSSYGLHVVTMASASSPAESKFFPGGFKSDLMIVDDILYATGPSLNAYDVSDPGEPELLDSLTLTSTSREMIIRGDLGYIASGGDGIQVVDLSDPFKISPLPTVEETNAFALAQSDEIMFAAGWSGGVHLLDVADPLKPEVTGSIETWDLIVDAAVSGDVAYLAATRTGLLLLDVSDPADPSRITSIGFDGPISQVAAANEVVFAAAQRNIYLVDVREAPEVVGVIDAGGGVTDLIARDSLLYVSIGSDFHIFDVRDPAAPTRIGTFAYCVVWKRCLHVIDIADGIAYLGDFDGAVHVLEGLNLPKPRLIGTIPFPDHVRDVRAVDGLAFVAAGSRLHILDLSDPAAPDEISSLDLGITAAMAVTVVGGEAYVSAGSDGIVLVDVSNPADPRISARSYRGAGVLDVGPNGLVYVEGPGGLLILQRREVDTSVDRSEVVSFPDVDVYPNPFSTSVTLHITTRTIDPIRVEIFDLLGRHVRTMEQTGGGNIIWDGDNAAGSRVSNGVYLFRVLSGESSRIYSVVLRR